MTVQEDIAEIRTWGPDRTLGRWEMAVAKDPISSSIYGAENALPLVLIVHQESRFAFAAHIIGPDDGDGSAGVLVGVIKKHGCLPDVLVMRDQALADELAPVTERLRIKTEVLKRLTAVPEVLRAMTHMLRL